MVILRFFNSQHFFFIIFNICEDKRSFEAKLKLYMTKFDGIFLKMAFWNHPKTEQKNSEQTWVYINLSDTFSSNQKWKHKHTFWSEWAKIKESNQGHSFWSFIVPSYEAVYCVQLSLCRGASILYWFLAPSMSLGRTGRRQGDRAGEMDTIKRSYATQVPIFVYLTLLLRIPLPIFLSRSHLKFDTLSFLSPAWWCNKSLGR